MTITNVTVVNDGISQDVPMRVDPAGHYGTAEVDGMKYTVFATVTRTGVTPAKARFVPA